MNDINLIRKIAWSFHKSTGFDWDELFSEACWLYCKALKTYDLDRGALSPYVWEFISAELINFIKNERRHLMADLAEVNGKEVAFANLFESLSREAQKVAEVIIENPELFDCLSPQEAKLQAAEMLLDQGVRIKNIWCGMKDLKLAFQ